MKDKQSITLADFLCAIAVFLCLTGCTSKAKVDHKNTKSQSLQAAAQAALGQREGAIVVIDPQTGHVRAVVNPEIAFGSAFPPGSTMKPFTALAALRAGIIGPDTAMTCGAKYKREDVVDTCSHPPNLPPLTPTEALAYSCNYYFATVGEKLEEEQISSMLSDFGFGKVTGVDAESESAGSLARRQWQPESAVGEGVYLQVTPIQLAMAYGALFNGGKLFTPSVDPGNSTQHLRTQLQIDDKHREILRRGLSGAITFGTAAKAGLDSLPVYILGKTGTSTRLQGFRSQAWFAGVAFQENRKPDTGGAQLVVVVYLKNGRGSEAAEVARPIFAEFAGKSTPKNTSTYVTVNQVSENVTQRIPLEDYVLQVASTEASIENEPEALKALAIAARTYALKHIGRHSEEGYDFCSTTHCQRFETNYARPEVAAAVSETAGLVLRDNGDQMIDAYYGASCGGMTANLKSVWNSAAPDYLRGVQDNYCNSGPHYRWTDVIASDKLARALRSDPRTDVGETIRDVSVSKHDTTGRAEFLTLVGDRRREISGWEFKLIVGRALGWQFLKSSRFTVSRSGSAFVFRGGGFGHGLGLCQEGSHVMAERGQSFQQILAHYFPGTRVGGDAETRRRGDEEVLGRGDTATHSALLRRRVSASHFQLSFPDSVEQREAEYVLELLESNEAELLRRTSSAGIQARFPSLEVVINETTGDFVGRTGMPPWAAAATKHNRMELQPLALLKQRRILETTLRHELVHVLIDSIGGGQTPRWLTEGMAVHLAGEGKMMQRDQPGNSMSVEAVEQALGSAKSAAEMRRAYAAAHKLVKELIQGEGEGKVWQRVAQRRYSVNGAVAPALIG